ncbi:hypothetical protein RJT34_30549 [Clitoria ternatea]|uniref:At2g35280-like TPR domain-containing protein n=1 Tax=Clitoria ternatea TaxID=43366 RepID=A0AAN9EUT3_CLITE
MVISRLMKKMSNKKQQNDYGSSSTTSIKSLPKEMLVEVMARVASQSFSDLHNMKLCCKNFYTASEDKYVLQHTSLDKFPLVQWYPNDKELSFLECCKKSGNIESLYREGLRELFIYSNGKISGLERLKIAAQKGHREATYVYGMISLSSKDDKLRKQGIEHMRFLSKSKCITKCRAKVRLILKGSMWRKQGILVRNQTLVCPSKTTCNGWRLKKGKWLFLDDEDEEIDSCELCRLDHELKFFYDIFKEIDSI